METINIRLPQSIWLRHDSALKPKKIVIVRDLRIASYVKILPKSNVYFVETSLGTYYVFIKEKIVLVFHPSDDQDDQIWHM